MLRQERIIKIYLLIGTGVISKDPSAKTGRIIKIYLLIGTGVISKDPSARTVKYNYDMFINRNWSYQ